MATAILADANIQGQVARLVTELETGEWAQLWAALGVRFTTFRVLGIPTNTPDRDLWRLCQQRTIILITANRNDDGPDSLAATIRDEGTPDSLPVITIGNIDRLMASREYAERAMVKLLDYLLDLDAYRGTGRLYLP